MWPSLFGSLVHSSPTSIRFPSRFDLGLIYSLIWFSSSSSIFPHLFLHILLLLHFISSSSFPPPPPRHTRSNSFSTFSFFFSSLLIVRIFCFFISACASVKQQWKKLFNSSLLPAPPVAPPKMKTFCDVDDENKNHSGIIMDWTLTNYSRFKPN